MAAPAIDFTYDPLAYAFEAATLELIGRGDREDAQGSYGDWLPLASPAMTWDWKWQRYVQGVLDRVTSGEIDRLMIFAPPRHGKTTLVTAHYPVYRLERDPSTPIIVAAYNATLARKFSRKSRRIARTRFPLSEERQAVEDWETTQGGGLRAVGVGDGITGQGGKLILIDDPVKSREEAESLTYRDRVWEWFTDDLWTRREPNAAVILTLTRWHEDDLAGRILASEDAKNWTVVTLPALAEADDLLGRKPGEALCPERYDEAALADIRTVTHGYSWEALYQQRPTAKRGETYDPAWFALADPDEVPRDAESVLWFDRASTDAGGDYTAGVLVLRKGPDFWLWPKLHVQHTAGVRDQLMRNVADQVKQERQRVPPTVWGEQEPGSGGKDAAHNFKRTMLGHAVKTEPTTGSKESRAEPMASQAELGHVRVVRSPLTSKLLEEARQFPRGTHDDLIESAFSGFNVLARSPKRTPSPKSTAFFSG